MKNTNKLLIALAVAALAGCGGGGDVQVPKDLNVTVSSPTDPATKSSDLTAGKHIPTVPVADAPPVLVTVPSSSMNVTTGPDTMTIPSDQASQTAKDAVAEHNKHVDSGASGTTGTSASGSDGTAPSKLYCTPAANEGVLNEGCPEPYVPPPSGVEH